MCERNVLSFHPLCYKLKRDKVGYKGGGGDKIEGEGEHESKQMFTWRGRATWVTLGYIPCR